jgi:hypothetical protein
LRGRKACTFDEIAAGDESWFHYHYKSGEKFAVSREK